MPNDSPPLTPNAQQKSSAMEKSNKALLEARIAADKREQQASAENSRVERNPRLPGFRDNSGDPAIDALAAEVERRGLDF